MSQLMIVLLFALVAYWRIRNLYYNKIALEYRYKLFALRDKTRRYVIEGHMEADNFFRYMDTTVCRSIHEADYFNIWIVAMLVARHKDEARIKVVRNAVDHYVKQNQYAQEVFTELGGIMREFVLKKHYILRGLLKVSSGLSLLLTDLQSIKNPINRLIAFKTVGVNNMRFYPETSTAPEYLAEAVVC